MARKKCNGAGPAEKIKNKKQQSKNKWENVKKNAILMSLYVPSRKWGGNQGVDVSRHLGTGGSPGRASQRSLQTGRTRRQL